MPASFYLSVSFRCRVKILYLFLSHFYTLFFFLFGDDFFDVCVIHNEIVYDVKFDFLNVTHRYV